MNILPKIQKFQIFKVYLTS